MARCEYLIGALLLLECSGLREVVKDDLFLEEAANSTDAVRDDLLLEEAANSTDASFSLYSGMVFAGEWRLVTQIDSGDPLAFPPALGRLATQWRDEKYRGVGSFGEAWEATGLIDGTQKTVILKIFFKKLSKDRKSYIWKNKLKRSEKNQIEDIKSECTTVQQIVAEAKAKRCCTASLRELL